MFTFKKYESIANDNNQRTIDYYKEKGFTVDTEMWYATEKVHGTNFSFLSDGSFVCYAQRSGVIEGSFMNHTQYTHLMDEKILALAKHLGKPIQVYTEYYGAGIINKGAIRYFNDDAKAFVAYDILLVDENQFVGFPENMELFDKFEIPRVQVIAVNTFDNLMVVDNHFKSFVAANNNVDTYAEGIVLKPVRDIRLETGDRVVLKRVSEQFAENRPVRVEKKEIVVDGNIIELINSKNTDIRIGKVAAKFGIVPSEKGKFATLLLELTNDIVNELTQEGCIVDSNVVKKQLVTIVKSFFE